MFDFIFHLLGQVLDIVEPGVGEGVNNNRNLAAAPAASVSRAREIGSFAPGASTDTATADPTPD